MGLAGANSANNSFMSSNAFEMGVPLVHVEKKPSVYVLSDGIPIVVVPDPEAFDQVSPVAVVPSTVNT